MTEVVRDSNWIVLKFGGTSVSTLNNWQRITQIIKERLAKKHKVFLVHSALSQVSNMLEQCLTQAQYNQHADIVEQIKVRHLDLAHDMEIDGETLLAEDFETLEHVLQGISLVGEYSARTQAKIMALGELMATRLSAAYLTQILETTSCQWLDARKLLVSTNPSLSNSEQRYLDGSCDFARDPKLIEQSRSWPALILTQGFIASNKAGETVLLGRGGSDTSGAYFAAKLSAACYEIWTDVPGMFTANPKEIPSAKLIRQLAYDEAQEIATTGAKVLHPRCILPVKNQKVPTRIYSTERPDLEGTFIYDQASQKAQVKAISIRKNITLLSMETVGMWHQVGFLSDAFQYFKEFGLSIDLVSTSESNVTVSLDSTSPGMKPEVIEALKEALGTICHLTVLENCAAISVVGRNIRTILHKIGPAFEIFHEHKVHLLSQAANDLNLTIVVDDAQADRLVQQLHAMFIGKAKDNETFGPSWESLYHDQQQPKQREETWWMQQAENLLALEQPQLPLYVYNLGIIKQTVKRLQGVDAVDRVFYAMKANNNEAVLKAVEAEGIGFECVSQGELELIRSLFPTISPARILFTPNFASRHEYEFALELGCHVTLDNIYPLEHWPDVFQDKSILIRVDPGQGRGHHEHVKTAGNQSKFGIPLDELDDVARLCQEINCTVVGLHAHTGSGILNHDNWQDTAIRLTQIAERFPHIQYLDIGGGLGVPEKQGQVELDLAALNRTLLEVKKAFPHYELWLEPGRYLVAQAGVLLAQVTQIKGKGDFAYVGLNTGMNSLIRPALYGAYHDIVNLTRLAEPAEEIYDVVGPICETGDKLGVERLLPKTFEGDVILIANAGAYGEVMSSQYNLRSPAEALTVDWI